MRRYRLKRQVAFLWILLAPPVESSVIFPVKQTTLGQSKRKHKHRQNQSNFPWTGGIASLRNANPSMVSNNSRMPLAFSAQHGGLLLVAASLGYIGKMLKSEAVNRAFYFWVHAGPIVFHYKFTRWYLCKTHAPLEKRDKVYNVLHEKYCNRTMGIVLHLKGEIYCSLTFSL